MKQVTQSEFFAAINPQDVHPSIVPGPWPWASLWKTPAGAVRGKSVDYLAEGTRYPILTHYFLPEDLIPLDDEPDECAAYQSLTGRI